MMDDMTTVHGGNFRSEDISHKPRRTQADNLKNAIPCSVENCVETVESPIPTYVTKEAAIKYFETADTGSSKSLQVLYQQTATWLREYLTISKAELSDVTEGEEDE